MMLKLIIQESGVIQADWAKRFGVSSSYLSDLLNGKKRPSLDLAFKIERETSGRVLASSWVDVFPAQPVKKPRQDAA
jgi:transcriptional regulator with XRE-family HTH domain